MSEDETARATLARRVDLTTMADGFALGWKQAVLAELDLMRAEMPYADVLELRLACEREAWLRLAVRERLPVAGHERVL